MEPPQRRLIGAGRDADPDEAWMRETEETLRQNPEMAGTFARASGWPELTGA